MQKYTVNEQPLAFDRVLLWEGQAAPLVWENDICYLQQAAGEAKSVCCRIAEQTFSMTKGENGIWRMVYPFRDGIQYIQLLIDGAEVLSPLLPITYGYSRPYNYVALEKEDEDFYRIKDVPHGSVRREYYFSTVTGEWESCMVYTPAEYETLQEKIFPVLYLQHGHGENEIGWTASGKAHFILDNLIAENKAVPFVIVMSNGMVQTVGKDGERIVDFRLFEQQMLKDILPFIEKKFRVGTTKEMRAMAGLSMGSLQTSMIGFSHPELFSALGVFSGFVSDMITGSPLDLAHDKPGDNAHLAILEDREAFAETFCVFFRAMGDADPFWGNFAGDDRMLAAKDIPQIRRVYQGTHDWNVWRRCFYDFAQLIFK